MNKIQIYCDGGCQNNGQENNVGGWGVVMIFNSHIKQFWGWTIDTTNQQMELQACIQALKKLKTDEYKVEIYSDSAYLINAFNKKWLDKWESNDWRTYDKKPVKNKKLWQELIVLNELYDIEFYHVQGHNGNRYNEQADSLVQKAINFGYKELFAR